MSDKLTPELLLSAYAQGMFPMARGRSVPDVEWFSPELRGIIPLQTFHAPKSLLKFMKKMPYRITMNQDFHSVITACANNPRDENGTWINDEIIEAYCELHALGFAQSVEVWESTSYVSASVSDSQDKRTMVGGLYGVSIGRAFFGESMFSHAPNASKTALVTLVDYLRTNDYTLLDTQYVNEHLLQFGVCEIPREEYMKLLEDALSVTGDAG